MRDLELLAPARNADIGIAAIDCGADAVYIAGPAFGARRAAGNPMEEIRRLCGYAHRFGARIFMTLNTVLFDSELEEARNMLEQAAAAGVDCVIAQDLAVMEMSPLPVHASTQCAIRTPQKARFYEGLGCSRVVLERQMSLDGIRAVRDAVDCELEFFVHGALCVCYSGQCYMSERVAGRSANRGECIQACRSLYDLVDGSGKVLAKDKALLSLKDYNLLHRLEDLAEAGVMSFKIEGRLKNISYVRNVVRMYSKALDDLVERHPDRYRRASWGVLRGGFTPSPDKTFNRGYTELFLDGRRGRWSSMDAPKSMGEEIGTVEGIASGRGSRKASLERSMTVSVRLKDSSVRLHNGDGFSALLGSGEIVGFRGDVCRGSSIECKYIQGLRAGDRLFRNLDTEFERSISSNLPVRLIPVATDIEVKDIDGEKVLKASAFSQDGRSVSLEIPAGAVSASNRERMESMIRAQISKTSGIYSFILRRLEASGDLPLMSSSALNAVRHELAECLDAQGIALPSAESRRTEVPAPEALTYKDNVANGAAKKAYSEKGAREIEDAFDRTHRLGAELIRTKYCSRYELAICPVHQKGSPSRLYLVNNGRRYALGFDCGSCEMTVSEED